jgi:AraC-like DNA-binding protein
MHRRARVWWATAQARRGRDPASYVPADRARRHVEELRASGWSSGAIARAAGIAPATITRIRKPATAHCTRIVARAILAVT